MNAIARILTDLQDTDATIDNIHGLLAKAPGDDIAKVNLETIEKRRRDLERKLETSLRRGQLDLVTYRIGKDAGTPCPAAAVGKVLALFQEMITSAFDAVRTSPTRIYSPSPENIELSTLILAAMFSQPLRIELSIPNDRLLAIQSDLDVAFDLVFRLLRARTSNELKQIASIAGVAPVSRAYQWAKLSAAHGFDTSITWRKSADQTRSIAVALDAALALQAAIESTATDRLEEFDVACELVSLDDVAGTFVLHAFEETIGGQLGDGFRRRQGWTTYSRYVAHLRRLSRIRYATGEEVVRWLLQDLVLS